MKKLKLKVIILILFNVDLIFAVKKRELNFKIFNKLPIELKYEVIKQAIEEVPDNKKSAQKIIEIYTLRKVNQEFKAIIDFFYSKDKLNNLKKAFKNKKELGLKLIEATSNNNLKEVQNLINLGAHLNVQTKFGYTALMLSVISDKENITKLLINSGANINLKDLKGNSAFIAAIRDNQIKIVRLFIGKKININEQLDSFGHTPLMIASASGHKKLVNLLIRSGIDIFAKNNNNETALDLSENNEIRDIILKAINNTKINKQN